MFWKKKQKQEDSKEIGFEERERKTPVAGYVLLIAMTIISVWLGFTALNDLEASRSRFPIALCRIFRTAGRMCGALTANITNTRRSRCTPPKRRSHIR